MSTKDLQVLARSFVHGLHDSIVGFVSFYKLDQVAAKSEKEEHRNVVLTELQRRRAEKQPKKLEKKDEPPKIRKRILQCCLLNGGVFLASIFVFNHMILPILEIVTHLMLGHEEGIRSTVWSWLSFMSSWLFKFLWILPLFILSKVVSFIWFQDIADAAYVKVHRKPSAMRVSLGTLIADLLFSLLIQTLFLCQAQLTSVLPIPAMAQFLSIFHISLLNAFYAFEYKWLNMGWEVNERLHYVESRWTYFMGFGLPLALATFLADNYWIGGCIFSVLFPLLIVSANSASPASQEAPFVLPVFALVSGLSNYVVGQGVGRAHLLAQGVKSTPAKEPSSKD
ncbi:etoposide-induced protein 2.4 homolog [Paramacrobiotus metropolitanus]|uniref:etoposide-induced protein 2.4 homolog n=1 Tax=Paramacrobiotus metropolitanus TaxID=2943436 RepID=UPI0024463A2E|nr:etoposide-induced protein 2.4 homolog [Paramacrobiotus metropolitanus]